MKKKLFVLIICAGLNFGYSSVFAQENYKEMYEKKEFISDNGDTLFYRILYPVNYDKSLEYPLVLFLHGAGERGNDNEKQLVHGGDLFASPMNMQKHPAIVVFPQCPENNIWSEELFFDKEGKYFTPNDTLTDQVELLIGLLNFLEKDESIDKNREYVMGLSMGGIGTIEMLCRQPNRFAAAIPMCPAHDPNLAERYQHVPIWFFHGALDDVISPDYSGMLVAELRKLNADVKYTVYPNANHNCWDSAFQEPGLLDWLFGQSHSNL